MNPATLLRSLGPKPWQTGVPRARDPSARRPLRREPDALPALLPVPGDPQADARRRARPLLRLAARDRASTPSSTTSRLVEDDWEQPTLGAWGLGWEVWVDGMEITQFTYFQQVGGLELDLIPAEITYGLDRLAMVIQEKPTGFDLEWAPGSPGATSSARTSASGRTTTSRRRRRRHAHAPLRGLRAPRRGTSSSARLPLPAYDQVLKASHAFNLLDARGAISVTERAAYIGRVRNLVRAVAQLYLELQARTASCRGCCLRSAARSCRPRACREAGLQLPELAASSSAPDARALHRAAAARVPRRRCPSARRTSGSRARPTNLRDEGGGGLREEAWRDRRRPERARRLPRRRGAGEADRRRAARAAAAIVRGLAVRQVDGLGRGGFRFARPVRWLLRQARRRDGRRCARGRAERRLLVRPPLDASGRGRDPVRARVPRRCCARPAWSRTAPCGDQQICAGLDALGGWRDPLGQARRGRLPRRVAARAGRRRSTSGSCGCPSA